MRRIRNTTDGPDAEVAAELAVASRAVRRAMSLVEGRHRAAAGDYDARRATARVRRDLERCLEVLRSVRPVGTVGDEQEAPPVPRRTPAQSEVIE
jgi:hypothetical protein